MANVRGKNVTVRIYDNGAWRLYACARSCSLQQSTSTIETSVTGSGLWATFVGQKHSWTITLEGVVNLDEGSNLTLYELRVLQDAFTELQIQYEREDDSGNIYYDQGVAIIVSSSDTGAVDDINTFGIELQGTGVLLHISEVPYINEEDGDHIITEDGAFIITE